MTSFIKAERARFNLRTDATLASLTGHDDDGREFSVTLSRVWAANLAEELCQWLSGVPKYERVGWHRVEPDGDGVSWRSTEPPDGTSWEPVYRKVT